MSIPVTPPPAMLFLSILSARFDACWEVVRESLECQFGRIDFLSEEVTFQYSAYYNEELGTPVKRRIVSFEKLQPLDTLADIKLWTNALELAHAKEGQRVFNLDPGFLTLQSLILATGKVSAHRVFLKDGIWADLTLLWQKKQWVDFAWTFPDYADHEMKSRLTKLRQLYKNKLNISRTSTR